MSAAAVASHGDMTPAVRPGMLVYPEAERVGRGIGAAAAELHDELAEGLSSDFTVHAALRQLDTTEKPVVDGIHLESPRIGWAKTAGAAENTTPVLHLIPPFKAGWGRRRPRGPHAEKRIAGTEWGHSRFVGRPDEFPTVLPIHLLRLGSTAVVGVPFETTVEAGRRIGAAALESSLGVESAFVSSLVNDQTDYLTTREEYAAQYYEGASVLFGPQQLAWVAGQTRKLANDVAAGIGSTPRARSFDFGVRRYLAEPTGDGATRLPGDVRFVDATPTEDAYWEQLWTDVAPGDLLWHEPLVRVEVENGGAWHPAVYDDRPVDDEGWHLGVTYLGRQHARHTYAARWYAPPLGSRARHRFVLVANGQQPEIAGPAFD